jgi:hypothetical protein
MGHVAAGAGVVGVGRDRLDPYRDAGLWCVDYVLAADVHADVADRAAVYRSERPS